MADIKSIKSKVAIVGVGFVGGALFELLKGKIDVKRYDPYKEFSCSKSDVNNCDIIFLCVPTPFDWKTKDYDYSAIEESLGWIKKNKIVVIKSTVQPGTCQYMSEKFGHKIIFNPEFLREKTAIKDIKNEKRVILGGEAKLCRIVRSIYQQVYKRKILYVFTSWGNAELTKIATNTYLCAKVSFCNELKEFCDKSGISYDEFKEIWLTDERIGASHTDVTEEGGFSGHCFPKDLNALITKMKSAGVDPICHTTAWNTNRKYNKEFENKKFKR